MNKDKIQVSKSAITSILGSPIAYYADFAKLAGDVSTGVFISQFFYWLGRGHNPDGWIYKTQTDIEEETGLSRANQETARKKLKALGLLDEQLRGLPAKMHYKLNIELLLDLVDQQSSLRESRKLDEAIPAIKDVGTKQSSLPDPSKHLYTENTTENTSKNTTGVSVDHSRTINKAKPSPASGTSVNKNNNPGGKQKYNSPQQNSLSDFVAFGEKYGIDRASLIAMKDAVLEVTGDMELSMSGSNAGERALDIAQDTVKTLIVHSITTPQMVLNLLPVWRARHYTSKDRETGKKGDRAVPHTSGLTDVAKDIKTGAYGWDTTPAKPAFKPERFEYRGYMVETINEEGDFIDPDAPHIINARKGGMKYFDMEMFNRNLEKESK